MKLSQRVAIILIGGTIASGAVASVPVSAAKTSCDTCANSYLENCTNNGIVHHQGVGFYSYAAAPAHSSWFCDLTCAQHHPDNGDCVAGLQAAVDIEQAIEADGDINAAIKRHPRLLAMDKNNIVHVKDCSGNEVESFKVAAP